MVGNFLRPCRLMLFAMAITPFLCHAGHSDNDSIAMVGSDDMSESYRVNSTNQVEPDSADVCRLEKKAFWRATAETAGFNIGLWAFDRYALNGHYAYISWNSIKGSRNCSLSAEAQCGRCLWSASIRRRTT